MSDCPECESELEYPSVVWSFHVGRTGRGIGPCDCDDALPEDEDEDEGEYCGKGADSYVPETFREPRRFEHPFAGGNIPFAPPLPEDWADDEDEDDEICPRCELRVEFAERLEMVEMFVADALHGKLLKKYRKSRTVKILTVALAELGTIIRELDGVTDASDD